MNSNPNYNRLRKMVLIVFDSPSPLLPSTFWPCWLLAITHHPVQSQLIPSCREPLSLFFSRSGSERSTRALPGSLVSSFQESVTNQNCKLGLDPVLKNRSLQGSLSSLQEWVVFDAFQRIGSNDWYVLKCLASH